MKTTPRKYFMIDTLIINSASTLRLRGTTMCNPQRVKFMSNTLGCILMRHLPASLKPSTSQPQLFITLQHD